MSTAEKTVSERKINANRINASKSTGPKTAEGKEQSRRNALKHGLTATVIEIPDENPLLFAARLDAWDDDLNPDAAPVARFLVKRAVATSIRLDRMDVVYNAKIAELVRSADLTRLSERSADVEKYSRLFFSNDSDIAHRHLRMTVEGCNHMLALWITLRSTVESPSSWDGEDEHLTLRLLNHVSANAHPVPSTLIDWTIVVVEHREVAKKLKDNENPDRLTWDKKYTSQTSHDYDLDRIGALAVQAEAARVRLAATIEAGIAELTAHRDILIRSEVVERSEVVWRLRFDASDEGKLLHRYEQEAERSLLKLIKEVRTLQKPPPKESKSPVQAPRNEPKPRVDFEPTPTRKPSRRERRATVSASKTDPKPRK
jgi:hypothetical protein